MPEQARLRGADRAPEQIDCQVRTVSRSTIRGKEREREPSSAGTKRPRSDVRRRVSLPVNPYTPRRTMLRSSVQSFTQLARARAAAAPSVSCSACSRTFASSSRSSNPIPTAPNAKHGHDKAAAPGPAAVATSTTDLLQLFDEIEQMVPEQVDPASQSLPPPLSLLVDPSKVTMLTTRYVSPRRPSLGPAAPEPRPGHLASATLASQPLATVPAPPRFQPGLPPRSADRLRPHPRPLHPVRDRPRRGRATEPVPLERVCHHHGQDQAEGKDGIAAQDAAQGRKSHPEGTRQSFFRVCRSPSLQPGEPPSGGESVLVRGILADKPILAEHGHHADLWHQRTGIRAGAVSKGGVRNRKIVVLSTISFTRLRVSLANHDL
jgi:hypothetical protein